MGLKKDIKCIWWGKKLNQIFTESLKTLHRNWGFYRVQLESIGQKSFLQSLHDMVDRKNIKAKTFLVINSVSVAGLNA